MYYYFGCIKLNHVNHHNISWQRMTNLNVMIELIKYPGNFNYPAAYKFGRFWAREK